MAGFYEPEILSRVQQMELEILKDVMELCDSHGLLCFGMAGTAIGAIRHKGFIPWDDDVDMVVERKYIERLLDAIEQRYPDRYFVEAPLRTPGYLSSFI